MSKQFENIFRRMLGREESVADKNINMEDIIRQFSKQGLATWGSDIANNGSQPKKKIIDVRRSYE